ncbi:DUF1464 domain-containing protein [Archaeoglobales archaeon]|nr:MAG: DUF1464 domain-containing protein [Archaeoglobales archaeon]
MIFAGIDPGTSSYEIFALDDDKPLDKITISTEEVRKNPNTLLKALKDLNADVIAGLSGYGLPIKKFSELDEEDVFLMTLNKDKNSTMGMRRLIEIAKKENLNIYTIPGVILLPTIPEWRKINRIDMGTADKLCSVCLALYQLSRESPIEKQNFVLVEAGFGFNAFISVKNGEIVDGIGGTSGFPAFSSLGAMDSELAYLLRPFPKSLLFGGGIRSYLNDRGIKIEKIEDLDDYVDLLAEFIVKGISVAEVSLGKADKILVSGKVFDLLDIIKKIEDFGYRVVKLKGFGRAKQSAEGAAIIANGIGNGKFRKIVDHLEIKKAKGSVLDYITSEFREYLDV